MSFFAKVTMLFVVFVDLLGQGLVFPILNSLIMEPGTSMLAKDTTDATRHFNYGLIIGIFFLCWFFGAPYISKLSDVIGRKNAILICLFGALGGYALTIAALYLNSFLLLILGRAITGLTAGNQPIAQAAMIDGSVDDEDRNRNMGYIITGVSFGLVGGPIIGGILSDPTILGSVASVKLPFYACFVLVMIAIFLVLTCFKDQHDKVAERQPFVFRPAEIFELLWQIKNYPIVVRLTVVFFFFHIANLSFYIFVDNYLTSKFGYGTFGGSMVMLTIGVALAFSSTFLVVPAQKRFSKEAILGTTFVVWAVSAGAFVASPVAILTFIPVFCFYFVFGIAYPTFLGLYSAAVGDEEQGWVMGVTIAIFTLVAGVISLLGGELIGLDLDIPFFGVIAAAIIALVVMFLAWNKPEIKTLTRVSGG
ncbi:MAG: MFS transporter [Roseibium album]|uniref:MFS transporter n=1 Tax=Roseibium album TaxID=311410 RepID=UPI000CF16224|nr:MFS transporter [Roseibium album]MBG6144717.1 putative MFS family arabinose efflux permease [Labrenzia sp. EL_142]MBG6154483.1 putative MFS family arabinose efflux permease [Labrenzia sp. EL_162]MBG6178650.1 putative MFS family arabinose efflux permease [Labrenzia sp. EL_132]MBG6193388.1 putative MFS family arabinose efflux permease [Labrenzia sp. EL_159]MBG6199756.1 putative MFS family arabinose efflux permease [Labrenzia sp. EL_13]MBG6233273.1 putative MFS family arabinose efflux permeas